MRCTCPECGAFMPQAEKGAPRCLCPECGHSCSVCMGTPGLVAHDALHASLLENPLFRSYFPPSEEGKSDKG